MRLAIFGVWTMPFRKRLFAPLALLAVFIAAASPAAGAGDASPQRTMTVAGQGEVRAVPDEAQLTAGVVTQAHTAADALAANSRAMNGVFDALKRLGIPEKSIQTSDFSVSAQYAIDSHGNQTQKIIGYQVSNDVTVVVDDLSKLGPSIDALVSSGANSMGNIEFTIRDPKPFLDEARAKAVKDALDRAEVYSKAAGIALGPIQTIGESNFVIPRPRFAMAMNSITVAQPTPVAAGEDKITAGVSITFEIR